MAGRCCSECGIKVQNIPTTAQYRGQEIYLFDPAVCENCLPAFCERYSTTCANCGGTIPPFSQVGVLKGDGGQKQFIHMTPDCWTAGSAFHGYWGKGHLLNFVEIEAC